MSFRRAAKVDANQSGIVEEFKARGASVKSVAQLKGFVDIVVGYRGHNFLIEIKNMEGRGRRLTEDEIEFHATWKGSASVMESRDEVEPFLKRIAKTYGKTTV